MKACDGIKSFTISENDAGQRLDKFLTKSAPKLPKSLLYKYIRIKRIKRNGGRCEIADRLEPGDLIECYVADEFFEEEPGKPAFLYAPAAVDVIYEDQNILLANKPAGLLVHEGDEWSADTLILRIQHYLYKKGEYSPENENSFAPALCNRIDRNTCGIVIAAKNAAALRCLNDSIKARAVEKKYLCVVDGAPAKRSGTIESFLQKNEKTNTVEVFKNPVPGGRNAVTKYYVIESKKGMSLVEAELLTGRTHQIRAQLASIGCPLVGDTKYGRAKDGRGFTWQALCSYKVTFHSGGEGPLAYLDGRTFQVSDAWFLKELGFAMPQK